MNVENTELTVLKPESMTVCDALEIQRLFLTALKEYQKIEVDLSKVIDIDCAGLQLMVALKNDAQKQQKEMVFNRYSAEVSDLLALFNMNDFFGERIALS